MLLDRLVNGKKILLYGDERLYFGNMKQYNLTESNIMKSFACELN
jgi:hypothetical protein